MSAGRMNQGRKPYVSERLPLSVTRMGTARIPCSAYAGSTQRRWPVAHHAPGVRSATPAAWVRVSVGARVWVWVRPRVRVRVMVRVRGRVRVRVRFRVRGRANP